MQILGLLGMYFDAAVVFVKTFLLLFRLALAILCDQNLKTNFIMVLAPLCSTVVAEQWNGLRCYDLVVHK